MTFWNDANEHIINRVQFYDKNNQLLFSPTCYPSNLGRTVTFQLDEGEELLGCEMDLDTSKNIRGITWLTWNRSKI